MKNFPPIRSQTKKFILPPTNSPRRFHVEGISFRTQPDRLPSGWCLPRHPAENKTPGTQTLGDPSSQPSLKHTQTFSHHHHPHKTPDSEGLLQGLKHTHCPGQEGLSVASLRVGWSTRKRGGGGGLAAQEWGSSSPSTPLSRKRLQHPLPGRARTSLGVSLGFLRSWNAQGGSQGLTLDKSQIP